MLEYRILSYFVFPTVVSSSWVFSSHTNSAAYSCDTAKQELVGYTCSCTYPSVECRDRNITDITQLDIPDKTEVLDLSRNLIRYLNKSSLSWQAPIKELFLSHNLISNISYSAFGNLQYLQTLDLSFNQIYSLQSGLFNSLYHLETLSLSHNHLSQLNPDLLPQTNILSKLDLSNNPLGDLTQEEPNPLSYMSHLLYLDMTNCSLSRLHITFLQNTSQLVELRLSNNKLDYVPTTTLYDTRATLQLLDMSLNPLKVVPSHGFHGLYGLTTLLLNNMPELETIEALAFHDLHSLATLECQNNPKLSYIHTMALRDNLYQERLDRVNYLDLSGNNLTSLSEDLVDWSSTQFIYLARNPWSCTCSLSWLASLAANQSLADQPTCASPDNLDKLLSSYCSPQADWILPILLTVSMICLPIITMLAYMAAQAKWPDKLPAVYLLGKKRSLSYHRIARG